MHINNNIIIIKHHYIIFDKFLGLACSNVPLLMVNREAWKRLQLD